MTRFPDGRVNATPFRVAHWIFAEDYVDREAFDEESSDEEESASASGAKAAPEPAANSRRANSDEASTSSMCGWCFGSVTKDDIERVNRTREEARAGEEDGAGANAKFDVKAAKKELEEAEDEIERLERSALQRFYDMERAANLLRERFTLPMIKNHPRSIELQSDIKRMDTELKQMIFNRDALKMKAQKLRQKITAHEAMNPPKPVVADRGKKAKKKRIFDPFEELSGGKCGVYVLLFLALAPLHLWHHYEWIQTTRVLKPKLKENGAQTQNFITYFYNPLLVPGARRLRLPASNAEIVALLLAVQSLIGFKLWVLAQPENERDDYLSRYHYMVLNTFLRVAQPCCNATIRALRWAKRRARERAVKKLWTEEPMESQRLGLNPESFIDDSDNDVAENVNGGTATAREQARAYVRVRRSRRQKRGKSKIKDVQVGERDDALGASKERVDAAKERVPEAAGKRVPEAAESAPIAAGSVPTTEKVPEPDAEEIYAGTKDTRSDTDDTDSFHDSFAESEISSVGEEVVEVASLDDFSEFKRKGADLSSRAYKQALKLRLLHEVRATGKGGRFTSQKFSEDGDSSSRETEEFSQFITASLSGSHGMPVNPKDEAYAKLRREYVLKARAERKAEEEANEPTKRAIFDVSDMLGNLLAGGNALKEKPAQPQEVDEAVTLEKSQLNVDQADTVSRAVLRLSARHKKQAERKYWPDGATLRSIDQSKVARAVAEEEVYA